MTTPIIECRNLQKWYSGVHALKNVSLIIHPGETVGLVIVTPKDVQAIMEMSKQGLR